MAANLLHATRRGGLRRTSPSCRTCCGPNAAVYLPIPCCKETAASRWPLTVASFLLAGARHCDSLGQDCGTGTQDVVQRSWLPPDRHSKLIEKFPIVRHFCHSVPRSSSLALLEHLRHQRPRDHAASGDDAGDGLPQSRPSPSIAHKAAPPCARRAGTRH